MCSPNCYHIVSEMLINVKCHSISRSPLFLFPQLWTKQENRCVIAALLNYQLSKDLPFPRVPNTLDNYYFDKITLFVPVICFHWLAEAAVKTNRKVCLSLNSVFSCFWETFSSSSLITQDLHGSLLHTLPFLIKLWLRIELPCELSLWSQSHLHWQYRELESLQLEGILGTETILLA